MEAIAKNLRILKRLDWFFIILGLIELFVLVFLTSSFFGMILGLITTIPAYIALTEKNIKWNYFVGIWTMVKYNPIILIAMVAFVLGDFVKTNKSVYVKNSTDWDTVFAIVITICLLLLVLASFILGLILIVNTAKHNRLKKTEMTEIEKQI